MILNFTFQPSNPRPKPAKQLKQGLQAENGL
jgi:hypothetical protein